ncbi:hypothetical protein E4U53_006648 [Claviceps sorghi]|nr:hypothetical protein E4U53_006648 [Claviceps sorghi]
MRDSSALLRYTTPEAPSKNLCSIEMSGGLMDASIDPTASSTITSAPSDLDDVFAPETNKEERDDFLAKRYHYQRPLERPADGFRCPSDLQSPIRRSFNFSHGRSRQSPTRL